MNRPDELENRRPIASRNTAWAERMAKWLVRSGVSANAISMTSMVFAALAGGLLASAAYTDGILRPVVVIAAILAIQGRLLCNLFDGMVAVEGGRATKDGPFWNEFPDRVADLLILVGAGYAAGAASLGWAATGLAIFTAYVRELGRANGAPADFSGPMAKQHRMAALCLALVASLFDTRALMAGLGIIVVGTLITVWRRAAHLIGFLKAN